MKILATILLIWLVWLLIGSFFGILGKLIWIAILVTVVYGVWKYLKEN